MASDASSARKRSMGISAVRQLGAFMNIKNQRGGMTILFVLWLPLFCFLLLFLGQMGRWVIARQRLQESVDKSAFAGGNVLADTLNHMALQNREVHQKYLNLRDVFRRDSKMSESKAKQEIQKILAEQNLILENQMLPLAAEAYQKAYRVASDVLRQNLSQAGLVPLYVAPVEMKEGHWEEVKFDKIEGVVFDPSDHGGVAGADFQVRMGFSKALSPVMGIVTGGELHFKMFPGSPLEFPVIFKAVAAAQPFAGSIWQYALNGTANHLYHTAMVSVKSLPREGFLLRQEKEWSRFSPDAVEH